MCTYPHITMPPIHGARIEAIAEGIKDENPNNVACKGQHQIPVCFNTESNVQARPLVWPNRRDAPIQVRRDYLWRKAPVLSTTTTPPFMTQRTFLTAASISVSGSPSTPTISAK
jgi:hypothetical protein